MFVCNLSLHILHWGAERTVHKCKATRLLSLQGQYICFSISKTPLLVSYTDAKSKHKEI